mgnify:CR=1 FL=1|jgi:hypothetical protein|tara:strand:- start:55 stop:231 length:177 start_codon:yes stop_codon:yes gene_type:complete
MGIKEQLKELEDKLTKGLEKAYSKMLEFKKQKDSPIIMSKNGEIVEVDPNKITPHNKG